MQQKSETLHAFGRVDIVINNAGVVIKKPFVEVTEEDFDRAFGINAKAAFFVMQEAGGTPHRRGQVWMFAHCIERKQVWQTP